MRALRWTLIAATGALLAASSGCKAKGAAADANGSDGGDEASLAASLPDTVVIILDAGAEPGRPAPTSTSRGKVELISGLPAPCDDTTKRLGRVTFTQVDDDVVITSSKTKARARCKVKDSQTLMCDWIGMDGKPSVFQKPVTYGPNKPVVGAFDKTHSFRCRPQP
jgi:hypothetical protein